MTIKNYSQKLMGRCIFLCQLWIIYSKNFFVVWLGVELNMFFTLALLYGSTQNVLNNNIDFRNLLMVVWYCVIMCDYCKLGAIAFLKKFNNILNFIRILIKYVTF